MIQQSVNATRELAADSPSGEVEGDEVAKKLGVDPEDPGAKLYHAFKVAERRGRLAGGYCPGGMGLPNIVRVE